MRPVGIAALVLSLTGCASVHTEVVIPAPPKEVWAVLTDTARYHEWNPVMVQADGTHREGETVTYEIREPSGEQYPLEASVEKVVDDKALNQCGGAWAILTFDHTWELVPVPGGTRVVQREEYRGVGVLFWDESWIEPAYSRANEALKRRVLELRDRPAAGKRAGRRAFSAHNKE